MIKNVQRCQIEGSKLHELVFFQCDPLGRIKIVYLIPRKRVHIFTFILAGEIKAYVEQKTNHGTLEFVNYCVIVVKFLFIFIFIFFLVVDRETGFLVSSVVYLLY